MGWAMGWATCVNERYLLILRNDQVIALPYFPYGTLRAARCWPTWSMSLLRD